MIPPKYYISPPEQPISEEGTKKKNKKHKNQKMSAEEKRLQKRARVSAFVHFLIDRY